MLINKAVCRIASIYVSLAGLCLLIPWLLPVQEAQSESYALGFSNQGFLACLLVLFIGPAYFHNRFMGGFSPEGSAKGWNETGFDYAASTKSLRSMGIICFGACATFLLANSRNLAGYGESEYFLLRSALAEAGKVPYRDFEFAYGPLLVYGVVLLKWLGCSAGFALAFLMIAESAIGYLAFYYVTATLFGKERAAGRLMFFAVALATCLSPLTAGQNFTFLRFASALAFGCYVLPRPDSQRIEAYGVLSGLVFLLGWLVSPDVGLAGAIAFGMVVTMLSRRRFICGVGVAASLGLAVFCSPLVRGSLDVALQFAQGGDNFPVFPSIHIALMFVSVLLSTAYVAKRSVREDPIGWLVFLYSLGLLPAALGRCDIGHVVFNGFGFVLLAGKCLIESQSLHHVFERFCLVYGVGHFVLGLVALIFSYGIPVAEVTGKSVLLALPDHYRDACLERMPSFYQERAGRLLKRSSSNAQLISMIEPGDYVVHPSSSSEGLGRMSVPFFVTLEMVLTTAAYKQVSDELRGKTAIVPYGFVDAVCKPWEADHRSMTVLFAFPTHLFEQKNRPEIVSRSFCTLLVGAEVVVKGEPGGYTKLLMKKSSGKTGEPPYAR